MKILYKQVGEEADIEAGKQGTTCRGVSIPEKRAAQENCSAVSLEIGETRDESPGTLISASLVLGAEELRWTGVTYYQGWQIEEGV